MKIPNFKTNILLHYQDFQSNVVIFPSVIQEKIHNFHDETFFIPELQKNIHQFRNCSLTNHQLLKKSG